MITLLQCLKQACGPWDGPLAILPGVDVSKEQKRFEAGSSPVTLAEVPALPPPTLEQIAQLIGVPTALNSNVSCSAVSVCLGSNTYSFIPICVSLCTVLTTLAQYKSSVRRS